MQDQYVGDIGDFCKYGLLRFLCGKTGPQMDPPLHLGVVWYFTEDRRGGGGEIGYLNIPAPLFYYDPPLFNELTRIIHLNRRTVREIQDADIFPDQCEFFWDLIPRIGNRDDWRINALNRITDAELVFLDPNTGIGAGSRDHAYEEDLQAFANGNVGDRSLVVCQHPSNSTLGELRRVLDLGELLNRPIWTCQWGARSFLISPAPRHKALLRARLELFRNLWEFGELG